jgi:hypothetical protein
MAESPVEMMRRAKAIVDGQLAPLRTHSQRVAWASYMARAYMVALMPYLGRHGAAMRAYQVADELATGDEQPWDGRS